MAGNKGLHEIMEKTFERRGWNQSPQGKKIILKLENQPRERKHDKVNIREAQDLFYPRVKTLNQFAGFVRSLEKTDKSGENE